MNRGRTLTLVLIMVLALVMVLTLAADEIGHASVVSPGENSQVGGLVSIIGSAQAEGMVSYMLSCGLGSDPEQWIQIGESHDDPVVDSRLGFWDTTSLPDGTYTLRLRLVIGEDTVTYQDVLVSDVLVSNVPRTRTPSPTPLPSATPTVTPIPTSTLTPAPTLSLDQMTAALYVTQIDQYEPLCLGRAQYYSIWVSNVGIETVEHILVTDTIPTSCQPIMAHITEGAVYDGDREILWSIEALDPGQVAQFQIAISIPDWLRPGSWVSNDVTVSADALETVSSVEDSLIADCPEPTIAAESQVIVMPPTLTMVPAVLQNPTLMASPVPTRVQIEVPNETVEKGLDLLTWLLIVMVALIAGITGYLFYKRVSGLS